MCISFESGHHILSVDEVPMLIYVRINIDGNVLFAIKLYENVIHSYHSYSVMMLGNFQNHYEELYQVAKNESQYIQGRINVLV